MLPVVSRLHAWYRFPLFLVLVVGLVSCRGTRNIGTTVPTTSPTLDAVLATMPTPQREFRAAWVATVANIDWPSEPGLSVAQQQQELEVILDQAVALNLNAIVMQVRPTADAFFDSELEPWSEYLTGAQGLAPDPYYDPLAFAVDEAHKRGLELHAWFNPYRAKHPTSKGERASNHISNIRPDIVREYGEYYWLDPGEPDAADHSLQVILDVVKRYDIDGVHLDDYFYPYAIRDDEGNEVPFPDAASRAKANVPADTVAVSNWRRSNVDNLIQRLYSEIKAAKPWVKFGISPFGIWRPGNPPSVVGFDAYEGLYADARKWLREGWVDYFSPQLYWSIDSEGQPYMALLDWWISQNVQERHLWPGNYTSRIWLEGNSHWEPEEIIAQVDSTRTRAGAEGNIHFSMKALMPGVERMADLLSEQVYQEQALIPATDWLDAALPPAPELSLLRDGGRTVLEFLPGQSVSPAQWVIRLYDEGHWTMHIIPGNQRRFLFADGAPELSVVTAVSRTGQEGPKAMVQPLKKAWGAVSDD